ncbi:MAG: WG repeat-containing protein [Methyloligellaceae bacterium]
MQRVSLVFAVAFLTTCVFGILTADEPAAQVQIVKFDAGAQPKCAQQADLKPFEHNGKFGYKNKAGETVVPARYIIAKCFLETGIAAVADENSWAYIDRHGNVVLRPFIFDNGPDYFAEGLARFVKDGKMGFFDIQGRVVIDARFDWVEPFSNGRAKFCTGCKKQLMGEHWTMTGGNWGVIDRQSSIVSPPQ